MIYRLLLIATLLSTFMLVNVTPVSACSCWDPNPPQVALDHADVVFAGQVLSIQEPPTVGGMISSADEVKVAFRVSKIWKGPLENTLVVQTARDGATCGYHFEVGEEYLVYARSYDHSLSTDICTRTTLLDFAGEDLEALGEALTPPPMDSLEALGDALISSPMGSGVFPLSLLWMLAIVAILIAASLAALAIYWFNRKKQPG